MTRVLEDKPDLVVDAPIGFEMNHKLESCPLCKLQVPPRIDFVMKVHGRTLVTYYCYNDDGHGFSVHHLGYSDADHLQVYKADAPKDTFKICDKCYSTYPRMYTYCRRCGNKELREENRTIETR